MRDDGAELLPLIANHQAQTGFTPKAVVADCKYGTTTNFIALGQQGIRTHMGDLGSRLRNHHLEGIYPTDRFSYDAASDCYECPAGEKLTRHHYHHQRGFMNIAPGPASALRARWLGSAPDLKVGAASTVIPLRKYWTELESNHMVLPPDGIGNVASGCRKATLAKPPRNTASNVRAGVDSGSKLFRTT